MSELFAAGHKRPGEPWRVAAASSRGAPFDPEHFTLAVPCPRCQEPARVEAGCIHGVIAVTVTGCRHCAVGRNMLVEHARRAAERVLTDRGIIGGDVATIRSECAAAARADRSLRFTELCPDCDRPMAVEATLCASGILIEIDPCPCGFDAGAAECDIARARAALLFVEGAR